MGGLMDKQFIVQLKQKTDHPKGEYNALNYEVIEVKVISIKRDHLNVELINGRRKRVSYDECFKIESMALQHRYKVAYEALQLFAIDTIKYDLPRPLTPNRQPRVSGNPLRFAERNIIHVAQTNVYEKNVNVQKIIQVIAITIEDIEVLQSLMGNLPFMNDY